MPKLPKIKKFIQIYQINRTLHLVYREVIARLFRKNHKRPIVEELKSDFQSINAINESKIDLRFILFSWTFDCCICSNQKLWIDSFSRVIFIFYLAALRLTENWFSLLLNSIEHSEHMSINNHENKNERLRATAKSLIPLTKYYNIYLCTVCAYNVNSEHAQIS